MADDAPRNADAVNRLYGPARGLASRLVESLAKAGKNVDALTREDLAPFEELHFGGREATRALARLAAPARDQLVVDVGCGLGGPARTIAAEWGCVVYGVDLTEEFCQTARLLNDLAGLNNRVRIVRGDALRLPFGDQRFDLVWTQHASMNIPDKSGFVRELARVVRVGGRLAVHDIAAGTAGAPYYPAVWARDPAMSFLIPPEEYRQLIRGDGFRELLWEDMRAAVLERHRQIADRQPDPGHAIVFEPLLGPDWEERRENPRRSLADGRITVVRGIFERVRSV